MIVGAPLVQREGECDEAFACRIIARTDGLDLKDFVARLWEVPAVATAVETQILAALVVRAHGV